MRYHQLITERKRFMKLAGLLTESIDESYEEGSLFEVSFEDLQKNFVDAGKVSQEDFDAIKGTTDKSAYGTWLTTRVADKTVDASTIPQFGEYFKTFDKYKAKYAIKDLNQYKSKDQVANFIQQSTDLADQLAKSTGGGGSNKNLVPLTGVQELNGVGITLLGVVDGYQCFEVPTSLKGDEEAWNVYKKWLAKCSGRDSGENIALCTMAGFSSFTNYLQTGPYYVFFNMADPKSPYQFHYESNQFMDKNNKQII